MAERYDLIVIGRRPRRLRRGHSSAQLGLKVACIDKRKALGGTCLNVGCIPSKALLDSSELFVLARSRFARHGIEVGDVRLDLAKMLARKDQVVKGLTDGVAFLFKKHRIAFIHGTARLGMRARYWSRAAVMVKSPGRRKRSCWPPAASRRPCRACRLTARRLSVPPSARL